MNTVIVYLYHNLTHISLRKELIFMNLEMIKKRTVQTILQFSVPAIIAMVLTSLITIVDGFFIGNYVGKEGIAAVNLGLPILYVYLGIGIMIGVGGMAIAGMALGAQDSGKCIGVFNQTVVTVAVAVIAVSAIVGVFFNPIVSFAHMDADVARYFTSYYRIMIIAYPVMMVNSALGMFIRGEGKPQLFMVVNVITVICNIVLDYVFIRWFGWGITGIATASLLSVIIGFVLLLLFFLRKSDVYKFCRFTFSRKVLRDTVFIGSSELIGQMSMSISMFAYNWVILKTVGVAGVAAFTIVGYIAYLFNMIVVGFGQGASPLISYSYGAEEITLSSQIRRKTNLFVFLTGAVIVLIMLLTSDWYSAVFVGNNEVKELIRSGIRIFVISFLFTGVNTITYFYFTSIGKAKESVIISSLRGFVLLLIGIVTLPHWFGMTGVWLVAPITECITIIVSLSLIYKNDSAWNNPSP